MGFETFCDNVFKRMESNLATRNEGLFWSAGLAIPKLTVMEKSPAHGIWYGTAKIGQAGIAGISVMLIHGELRVGAIIPKQVIDAGNDDDLVALSPDGNPHDALREVLGGYLYDRSYQCEPFSASWIVEAYTDDNKAEAVALTMASLVASTWKTAFDVIAKHAGGGLGHTLMLMSQEPLPIDALKQKISVVILDCAHASHLGYIAMTRSAHSESEVTRMIAEAGLKGITVSTYDEAIPVREEKSEVEAAAVARRA